MEYDIQRLKRIEENMAPNAVRIHKSQNPSDYIEKEDGFYEVIKGEKLEYIIFTNERGDTCNTRVQ